MSNVRIERGDRGVMQSSKAVGERCPRRDGRVQNITMRHENLAPTKPQETAIGDQRIVIAGQETQTNPIGLAETLKPQNFPRRVAPAGGVVQFRAITVDDQITGISPQGPQGFGRSGPVSGMPEVRIRKNNNAAITLTHTPGIGRVSDAIQWETICRPPLTTVVTIVRPPDDEI